MMHFFPVVQSLFQPTTRSSHKEKEKHLCIASPQFAAIISKELTDTSKTCCLCLENYAIGLHA